MADTTVTNSSCLEKLKSYVTTQKGSILAAEIVLSLIVLVCYAASVYSSYSGVAVWAMVTSTVFFVIFMMKLEQQFRLINWLWSDFLRAIVGAVAYFIGSLIFLIRSRGEGALVIGGVFGLIAGILFAYDTYTILLEIQSTRENTLATTGHTRPGSTGVQ